jgi:hypothetical protein
VESRTGCHVVDGLSGHVEVHVDDGRMAIRAGVPPSHHARHSRFVSSDRRDLFRHTLDLRPRALLGARPHPLTLPQRLFTQIRLSFEG